jgi:putative hydrolase of the HAD superfamily
LSGPVSLSDERGLLVDYGGVLTSSAGDAFRSFEREVGVPPGTVVELILEAYEAPGGDDPIARFERGESTPEEFASAFAARLADRGHRVDADDIHNRILGATQREHDMWAVVRTARDAGVRTALLSNSWGLDGYPVEELRAHFDTLVISGEVGLRKPDPAIYRLAAERLELSPSACAFVDDLPRNVEAARDVGMYGVHHTDVPQTAAALSWLLGIDLQEVEGDGRVTPGYALGGEVRSDHEP